MNNSIKKIIAGWLLATLILTAGCSAIQTFLQNPRYIYEDGAVLVDGADLPIELQNNDQAINVTFYSLIDFLRQDDTDRLAYIGRDNPDGMTPFVCSDFAERLHNNAEEAGIRAGYVSLDWVDGSIGHAINAFDTTDEGLVFIDCTGQSEYSQIVDNDRNITTGNWDKVAYVLVGRKYGVISIAYAESGDYSYFERYEMKWQEMREKLAAYNAEVRQYNQTLRENVFIEDSPEIERMRAWEKELAAKEEEINELNRQVGLARFRPLGIVDSYDIHW